ncbi:hypothetical protein BCV69DRAFT_11876 [Microstroma glucosiphilum]|uniref:Uncharacterized protein n=1 Tax=Pseudomicrostroma glucosiphilum TaxID=1684307 RepID=A0A316UHN6_9BASI|nr:hypothetical protein BCV69DRAFT_11876 [Pseudomicrostroma glucosiphilum]PWN23841.1 hypothetical protein BCV69DRAFT_11876 [Pseudomicrostroma glucosiphilum]
MDCFGDTQGNTRTEWSQQSRGLTVNLHDTLSTLGQWCHFTQLEQKPSFYSTMGPICLLSLACRGACAPLKWRREASNRAQSSPPLQREPLSEVPCLALQSPRWATPCLAYPLPGMIADNCLYQMHSQKHLVHNRDISSTLAKKAAAGERG